LIAPLFANGLQLQRHRGPPHANSFDDKLRPSYAKSRVRRSLQPALEVLARTQKEVFLAEV
jgi:hypothetical protein